MASAELKSTIWRMARYAVYLGIIGVFVRRIVRRVCNPVKRPAMRVKMWGIYINGQCVELVPKFPRARDIANKIRYNSHGFLREADVMVKCTTPGEPLPRLSSVRVALGLGGGTMKKDFDNTVSIIDEILVMA